MKKILSVLVVLMFAILLVGCNKGDDEGFTVVEFWHMHPIGDDGYQGMRKLIREFNTEYEEKGIKVKATGLSFWDYSEKLSFALTGGNAPDVGLATIDDVPYRAHGNVLINVGELIENDTSDNNINLDDFLPAQIESATYNDVLYAMPYTATTRVLYYNLDLFKENGLTEADVPTNWEELKTVSDKITKFDSNGNLEVLGFDPSQGNNNFAAWLWQKGLDFFDDDLNPTANTPENEEILKWVGEFNKEISRETIEAFGSANQMLGIDPFVAQKFGMIIDTDALYSKLKQHGVDFEYGIAPIPYPEDGIRINWASGFSLEMYKNKTTSEEKTKAVWEFYKFLLQKDTMKTIAGFAGGISSNLTAMEEFAQNDPLLAKLVNELNYAVDKKYIPYAPSWHGADWGPIYFNFLNQNITAKQALQEAQDLYLQKKANWEKLNN